MPNPNKETCPVCGRGIAVMKAERRFRKHQQYLSGRGTEQFPPECSGSFRTFSEAAKLTR